MKEDSKILQALHSRRLFFDGGTGTVLQSMGLPAGTPPEMWNLSEPEKITALHRAYLQAGSNIITTNTFGINAEKYENYEQMITAAVQCAENARAGDADTFIAFDMGPTGRLLHPLGDLAFEDAVSLYAKNVRAAVKADLYRRERYTEAGGALPWPREKSAHQAHGSARRGPEDDSRA